MTSPVSPLTHVRLIAEDTMLLIEQEVSLARQELDEKLNQAVSGLILAGAGLIAGFTAFAVLVYSVIAMLSTSMPEWTAALIVGGVCLVLGLVLLMSARSRLKPENLAPSRTVSSLSRTARTMKENIK